MDAKAVVDELPSSCSDKKTVDYQNEIAMVKNECSLLCDKLVEDLKALVTKDELTAIEGNVVGILDLQPRVTRELELRKQELVDKDKKLAENNHELAALKAKLQHLRSL